MASIVRFRTATDATVLIESVTTLDSSGGRKRELGAPGDLDARLSQSDANDVNRGFVGTLTENAKATFEDAMSSVTPMLETIQRSLSRVSHDLDSIEVEFGLKLTAGAHAIVSAGTEANFQFRVSWKPTRDASGG